MGQSDHFRIASAARGIDTDRHGVWIVGCVELVFPASMAPWSADMVISSCLPCTMSDSWTSMISGSTASIWAAISCSLLPM